MEPANSASQQPVSHRGEASAALALQAIADAVSRLRFGAIQLTVHDGRVVQLEVTEKQRFT